MAHSILVQLPSSFFSIRLVSLHMVHPYNRIDTNTDWKKVRFILSDRSDFHMINNLSIVVHAFASRVYMSFSVDETLLPRHVNLSTNFREPLFRMETSPFLLKTHVLWAFTWRPMSPAVYFRQCSKDSAWVGVFARSAMSSA